MRPSRSRRASSHAGPSLEKRLSIKMSSGADPRVPAGLLPGVAALDVVQEEQPGDDASSVDVVVFPDPAPARRLHSRHSRHSKGSVDTAGSSSHRAPQRQLPGPDFERQPRRRRNRSARKHGSQSRGRVALVQLASRLPALSKAAPHKDSETKQSLIGDTPRSRYGNLARSMHALAVAQSLPTRTRPRQTAATAPSNGSRPPSAALSYRSHIDARVTPSSALSLTLDRDRRTMKKNASAPNLHDRAAQRWRMERQLHQIQSIIKTVPRVGSDGQLDDTSRKKRLVRRISLPARHSSFAEALQQKIDQYRFHKERLAELRNRVAQRTHVHHTGGYEKRNRQLASHPKLVESHKAVVRRREKEKARDVRRRRQLMIAEAEQKRRALASKLMQQQKVAQSRVLPIFQQILQEERREATEAAQSSELRWVGLLVHMKFISRVLRLAHHREEQILDQRRARVAKTMVVKRHRGLMKMRALSSFKFFHKERERRRAIQYLHPYLMLGATMHKIRTALHSFTYRGNVIILQRWWRRARGRIQSQLALLDLFWVGCEEELANRMKRFSSTIADRQTTGRKKEKEDATKRLDPPQHLIYSLPARHKRIPAKIRRPVVRKMLTNKRRLHKLVLREFWGQQKALKEEHAAKLSAIEAKNMLGTRITKEDKKLLALVSKKPPGFALLPTKLQMKELIVKTCVRWSRELHTSKFLDKRTQKERQNANRAVGGLAMGLLHVGGHGAAALGIPVSGAASHQVDKGGGGDHGGARRGPTTGTPSGSSSSTGAPSGSGHHVRVSVTFVDAS